MPKLTQQTCYMCAKPGTTREHAPPLSFFPIGRRHNLITVPSCKSHNNDNSPDVEYVRNLVVTDINANAVAQEMFDTKVRRSYARGHKLRKSTFRKIREVIYNGKETAIVHLNETRFNPIIRAVAYALYFHDFGERFSYRWNIYRAAMLSEGQAFYDLPDNINPKARSILRSVPTDDRDTNQPEVFRYGVYQNLDHRVIYKLIFYGAVDMYAIGLPDDGSGSWLK